MVYVRELDDLRRELPKDIGGTIRVWPKRNGANVTVGGNASYTIHDPGGNQLASGTATEATDTNGDTYYDVTVSAGVADELGEGYVLRWQWTDGTDTYQEVQSFDVVATEFGGTVSYNDLIEERPDVDRVLSELADRMGSQVSDAETAAAVFGVRGRVELLAQVRNAAVGLGTIRARLIIDRAALNRVERKHTMKLVYAAIAKDPLEGDDTASSLYRFYANEAQRAWNEIGPIAVDLDEDMVEDATDVKTSVHHRRRVQGG